MTDAKEFIVAKLKEQCSHTMIEVPLSRFYLARFGTWRGLEEALQELDQEGIITRSTTFPAHVRLT
ncbi:hypothetical protein [Pandoraea apista]|uniref:hypothetical protein n=1 Tax=Pandoraea apista TaxID=93218 RepID=UPI00058A92D4|nr:hypothetical protein [Pandoraea apista]AJE98827.1 hypothetical protein SG18_12670 [Pandoraea apista]AKH72907.1 hypothetical protein XM39_12870 [Pandoraea apista]AKI61292.1 hypothetical protein AA956_05125 [Pandoraea apista]